MGFFDHDIVKQLKRIADALWELVYLERNEQRHHIVDFSLVQINQGVQMAITGVVVGNSGQFQIGFVPATNFIPLSAGPAVSVDDSNVTLGPVDATTFIFTATVAAGDTAASFNLTITGTNDAGTALTHTFNVPILPTPPPPPTSITDFSLNQLS